jgi:hypothetical protein
MKAHLCKRGRKEAERGGRRIRRAVAAAGFALCLPLIMLFLLGLWEVGRYKSP